MPGKKFLVITSLAASVILFQNCSKKDIGTVVNVQPVSALNLPETPYNYSNITFPAHIAAALAANDNTPAYNPITNDGATLGRVLFYDKNLSFNKTINCASCHKQEQGFTDDARLSEGFEGGFTTRNSMNLLNVRFYTTGKMFWDERASTLEEQVLQPVQNHIEMGMSIDSVLSRLNRLSYYPLLFAKAYGSADIDTVKIARALSQFVRSIVTYQAKYDRVKQGLEVFTANERDGEQLFLNATGPGGPGAPTCATCHTPPMFMNAGAPPFTLPDNGDLGILNEGRFKAGSLRNITATPNLFHNGSITNVETMLGSQVPAHGVAPPDRAKILAFLQTLTDNTVTTDIRFSSPFK
jgi:cytochrome c peroxidase